MQEMIVKSTITGVTALANNQAGVRISTVMLKPEELTNIFQLKDHDCDVTFTPVAKHGDEIMKVDSEFKVKTPSQRVRGCLFVLWEKEGKPGTFENYYVSKMEMIIEWIKQKL